MGSATGCGCSGGGSGTVGAVMCAAKVWLDGLYVNMVNTDVDILPAQEWLDCRDCMDVFLQLEFIGTGGANLTVLAQSAAALSVDSGAWLDVTSGSTTVSQTQVLKLRWSAAVPPMAVLRLKLTASGNVTGVLRVMVSKKEPA